MDRTIPPSRRLAQFPSLTPETCRGARTARLTGTYIEGRGRDYNPNRPQQPQSLDMPRNRGQMMEERFAARLPMALFTLNTRTGEVKVIHKATDWLNHLLFSPTDPALLMFCHEGPWHKLDRIWTIRTDGSRLTRIHTRTFSAPS